MIAQDFLPPPLIHELRSRSFPRLFRIAGNPGNRGFGRYLRQRIHRLVEMEETPIEKAITLFYLGSFLVDHIVFAEKTASRILEDHDLSAEQEQQLWDHHFGSVMETLLAEHHDHNEIRAFMARVDNYTRPPNVVVMMRERHWSLLSRLLEANLPDGTPAITEMNILRKVEFILASDRSLHSKAMMICLAASLMADTLCWNRGLSWSAAYIHAMTDLYPFLSRNPRVLQEIVCLTP